MTTHRFIVDAEVLVPAESDDPAEAWITSVGGDSESDAKMLRHWKHLEGQHDQSTHGRAGDRGAPGSESMVIEDAEAGRKDEERYAATMAAWEQYRDVRARMRDANGYDRFDEPFGLKEKMDRAKHIDDLVSKLNRMQGATKGLMTKYARIGQELGDLETKRWELQKFADSGPTNPVTGESTAHEYHAQIAEIDKQMETKAEEFEKAHAAYEKARESKMDRMIETVRQSIKDRMKDQLEQAQRVMLADDSEVSKSAEAIEKARSLLTGCVNEKIDWKAATCGVLASDPNTYGGNRAYFHQGNIHDSANMTLGQMHLPPGGADYKTVIHEFGHCLEQDYEVQSACQAFLWHRVGTEKPTSMQDVAPNSGYDRYELGRKDEFDKAFTKEEAFYIGKFYQHGASEVLSMGMEKLFWNPREFAEKDPEYFKFVVGILDGSLLPKVAK